MCLQGYTYILILFVVFKNRYSDNYVFCCMVQDIESVTECLPEPDQFSSCKDLMRNQIFRILIWIFGLSAFLGNGFVIVWRLIHKRKERKVKISKVRSNLSIESCTWRRFNGSLHDDHYFSGCVLSRCLHRIRRRTAKEYCLQTSWASISTVKLNVCFLNDCHQHWSISKYRISIWTSKSLP